MKRSRRAFTTTLALTAIMIVGMALAVMTRQLSSEATRTRTLRLAAQQQQLLLAGQALVSDALPKNSLPLPSAPAWNPALPPGIDDSSLSIKVEERDDTHASLLITARTADQFSSQRVTYHKDAGRWTLTAAMLTQLNSRLPTLSQ